MKYFWKLVKEYNILMNSSITGPDCTDPNICSGDCCGIMINVPRILAKEYIRRGYASKKDFIRADVFSFKLRFDEKIGKCFLFDKTINGCSVHHSGIKPPQCWIYPTKFSNPSKNEIKCKRSGGWKIINDKNTMLAEDLLIQYVFYCQIEARKEFKGINMRLGEIPLKNSKIKGNILINKIKGIAPSRLGGFIDTWDKFEILSSEGLSLQLKKFCTQYNKCCYHLQNNFLDCKNICNLISVKLIEFLNKYLFEFVKKNGPDTNGQYPLFKLFEFVKD